MIIIEAKFILLQYSLRLYHHYNSTNLYFLALEFPNIFEFRLDHSRLVDNGSITNYHHLIFFIYFFFLCFI